MWNAVGPIDILVNKSGVMYKASVLEHINAQWDSVIDSNLERAFLAATEVSRAMRAAGRGGSVSIIASILGLRQVGQVSDLNGALLLRASERLPVSPARCPSSTADIW